MTLAERIALEIKALRENELTTKVDEVEGSSLVSDTEIAKLATVEEGATKTSLEEVNALGVDAATVTGNTVGVSVPADAQFTDTTYTNVSELTNDAGYITATDVQQNFTETITNLTKVGNELRYENENGEVQVVDLSVYLDDTNLSKITEAYVMGDYLYFKRDDFSSFRVDVTAFLAQGVSSINGEIGDVTIDKTTLNLENVDNTSDLDKPISNATQVALDGKVDDNQVLTNVPAGAVFTDTTYENVSEFTNDAGYITSADVQGNVTETNTSLILSGTNLVYTDEEGTSNNISLAGFLDDTTNTIVSGVLSNGIITFTREDATTFQIDVSSLEGGVTSVNGLTGDITVQETLVSGTNIKTVNGESLLGSGNITIEGGTGGTASVVPRYVTALIVNKTDEVPNGANIFSFDMPFYGSITEIRVKTFGGTCDVVINNGGNEVDTITATTSGVKSTELSNVDFSKYQTVSFDIANSAAFGLEVSIISDEIDYISNYNINTSLLVKFDGDITDVSNSGVTFTNWGAPMISDTEFKFGTGSMYFNGSSAIELDGASAYAVANLGLNEDFTIDCWIKPIGGSQMMGQFGSGDSRVFQLNYNSSGYISIYHDDTSWQYAFNNDNPLSSTEWGHIALVRYNGVLTMYVNGVGTVWNNCDLTLSTTGGYAIGSSTQHFSSYQGYMDDYRIVKGEAIYTADFDPANLTSLDPA